MSKQVKIGVIGTSWWSDIVYLPVLKNYERANLVAVCGGNHKRADEMATKYHVPEVYTDYRRMIQQANLDAIVVSTPDDTHYEIIMEALDAGLYVLCEKPIAFNVDHARNMLDKARSTGGKHMVMYTHHWFPNLQRVRQLLNEGYIGTVYNGSFDWFAGYARSGEYAWRFDAGRANGILGDLGSHLIHMALWLLGDVTAVTGRLGYHVPREATNEEPANPANDTVHVILEFASGAQAQFFVTAVAHVIDTPMRASVQLHGDKGTMYTEWLPATSLISMSVDAQQSSSNVRVHETMQIDLRQFLDTHPVGVRLFVDAVLDDKPSVPGFLEGYKVQQVIDAVIESHESGCRIIIDSATKRPNNPH